MATRSKAGKSKVSTGPAGAPRPDKPAKGSAERKTRKTRKSASAKPRDVPFSITINGVEVTLEQLAALGLDLGLLIDIDAVLADPAKRDALLNLLKALSTSGSLIAFGQVWGRLS
jgi:hypothetical protein